jgi:hypothetical protein
LLLGADGGLIGDVKIGVVGVCFREAFLGQSRFDGRGDLPRGYFIDLLGVLDADPLVGLELREICALIEVVGNILGSDGAYS